MSPLERLRPRDLRGGGFGMPLQIRKAGLQIPDRVGIGMLFQSGEADIQNLGSGRVGRSRISLMLFQSRKADIQIPHCGIDWLYN